MPRLKFYFPHQKFYDFLERICRINNEKLPDKKNVKIVCIFRLTKNLATFPFGKNSFLVNDSFLKHGNKLYF